MAYDLKEKRMKAGKYKVLITRELLITVHSDYTADESDLVVKASIMGDIKDITIAEL